MPLKYCSHCERNVTSKKKFSWPWFLLWCLLFGVGGIVYIIWYIIKPADVCPICGSAGLKPPRKKKNKTVKHQKKSTLDPMTRIKKLQELKDSGAITQEEFNEKKKILLESI